MDEVALELERILPARAGVEALVGLRVHAKSKLAADAQAQIFTKADVLDRVEEVLPVCLRFSFEIAEVFVVAEIEESGAGQRFFRFVRRRGRRRFRRRLRIGPQLVVENDGLHGRRKRSGAVALRAGWHPITVTYFQGSGAASLDVQCSGPDIVKRPIRPELLWCKQVAE